LNLLSFSFRMRSQWFQRTTTPPVADTSHDEATGFRVRYSGIIFMFWCARVHLPVIPGDRI
jgi:hypothetical protein